MLICATGEDGEFDDPFEGGKPSDRTMRGTVKVPGAPACSTSEYDVAQALSW